MVFRAHAAVLLLNALGIQLCSQDEHEASHVWSAIQVGVASSKLSALARLGVALKRLRVQKLQG